MADQEKGLADGIVEAVTYEAPEPVLKKDFLAWHRPRKQYVRYHQWRLEIEKMIDAEPESYSILKYFGLPATDLLDLRYFHDEICAVRNITLRFLGFNTDARPNTRAQTELNLSLDEVRRLEKIDPSSDVIGDNFSLIAGTKSLAYDKARKLGPYDVINLDLCDGFGAQAPGMPNNKNYYNAVSSLFALQARTAHPWLLLLTTRADKQNINEEVLQRLLEKYIDNLKNCSSFRDASCDKFGIKTEESLNAAIENPIGLLPVFLTGLCKWFIGLALAITPPISVKLCSVVGYRVVGNAEQEDLISLALKFTPTLAPVPDPIGLANHSFTVPDECVLSKKALIRVAKRIDVDKKLEDDSTLRQSMIDATANLLSLARYDPNAYRNWAKNT